MSLPPSVALGDCCDIVGGGTPRTSEADFWGGDVVWATPKDLGNLKTRHISQTARSITRRGLDSCGAKILPAGSVLLSSRAPIGLVAINAVPMATNQGFKSLLPHIDKVDAGYLSHWLSAKLDYLQNLGSGATFKEISTEVVARIQIPLPSLDVQRQIAEVLDSADRLCTLRRETLSRLKSVVKSIFVDTFGNLHAGSDSKSVLLHDAYWFQEGPGVRKWQFRDTGVKLLNVANILKDGVLDLSKTNKYLGLAEVESRYRHFLVDEGDLVVASSGISFDDDGMLRTRGAFVEANHLPLCMNTSTIRFKAMEGLSTLAYLKQWLETVEFRSQISRRVTGSAQQNFGPSHLRELWITLPPIHDQQLFDARIARVEYVRSAQQTHLAHLDALFVSLQDRAFKGKL